MHWAVIFIRGNYYARPATVKWDRHRPAEWTQDLFNHMRIFLKKADDIVRETVRDKMLDRAIENSFKKHPEGIPITEEMMQEFLGELEKELIPWYVSRMVKND